MLVHSLHSDVDESTLRPHQTAKGQVLRVTVAGEVSSGKSSMINAIARQNLVPRFRGHEVRPALVLRYSEKPYHAVQYNDGTVKLVDCFEQATSDADDISLCLIGSPQPHLKGMELIELPFYHDGEVEPEALEIINSSDVTIWMTIASQAWRLSEKSILDRLHPYDASRMILAVSRADKLRNTHDKDRIRDRLAHETEGYFRDIFFMNASARAITESERDDHVWSETAGRSVYRLLHSLEPGSKKTRRAPDQDKSASVIDIRTKEPRDQKDGLTITDLAPAYANLPAVMETLSGVICAGIVDLANNALMPLGGNIDKTVIVAEACRNWVVSEEKIAAHSNGEGDDLLSQITMTHHFVMYSRCPEAQRILFMMCTTSKINPAIAKTAFVRMQNAITAE